MLNRLLVSMMVCCALSAACERDYSYAIQQPDPAEQKAAAARAAKERMAAKAVAKAEERFREMVSRKEHVAAAHFVLNERLFDDRRREKEVRALIAARSGEVEGMVHHLERMNGYGELAHLVKKAGLPMELAQQYAASAFRAGVAVDSLDVVQNAVLHAAEFDVELELRQRAATRVWAMQIDREGWPKPGSQTFVDRFPLSGGFGLAAYTTAMDLGRWKAARMIAERAQLSEEQFRAARTKEIEELVATAIRARDDQRLLQLNLEAPGYVGEPVVRSVATRVVAKLLEEGLPGEAYAQAIAHGLDMEHVKRAADAFFAAAIKTRTFSLARQMPDGTFIIVERPPPPPTPPAAPSAARMNVDGNGTPSRQFENTGGGIPGR